MQYVYDEKEPTLGGNILGGDPRTFHPVLWDFLIERFAPRSVLDVGCAQGHAVEYFLRRGIYTVGFDGLAWNVKHATVPCVQHDLRHGPFLMPVDIVHCIEVVEHIDVAHLPALLRTLANGRVIVMTHALPDMPGHHHVNCQPPVYWISRIEALGYKLAVDLTNESRQLLHAADQGPYFLESGLIFVR